MRLAQASVVLLTAGLTRRNRTVRAHPADRLWPRLAATVADLLAALRERARARRRERAAIHHLLQLDPHLLRDIGLDRTDIRIAVRQGKMM